MLNETRKHDSNRTYCALLGGGGDAGRSSGGSKDSHAKEKGSKPKSKAGKDGSPRNQSKKKDDRLAGSGVLLARESAAAVAGTAPAPETREWQPTRSVLQQGARETGVKGQTGHVPGQGLEGLR